LEVLNWYANQDNPFENKVDFFKVESTLTTSLTAVCPNAARWKNKIDDNCKSVYSGA
jgi:hypothetical protein